MKAWRTIVVAAALVALAGSARPADDDPEPPPPIKVSSALRATVTVSTGANGLVLKITTTAVGKAKAKAKVKAKGKVKAAATGSFEMTYPEKQPPTRLTFQFKSHDRLTSFRLSAGNFFANLPLGGVNAKQAYHVDAAGRQTTDAKSAVATFTVAPGKDHLEVKMEIARGQKAPPSPWSVSWRGPLRP